MPPKELNHIVKQGYNDAVQQKGKKLDRERILGCVVVPPDVLRPEQAKEKVANWEILRTQLDGMSRINVGIAICKFGHEHVINRPFRDRQGDEMFGILSDNVCRTMEVHELEAAHEEVNDEAPLADNQRRTVPFAMTQIEGRRPQSREIYVPLLEYNRLIAIERDEIESVRSIRNFINAYVKDGTRASTSDRPMSIAVFGAPGSRKSFAVKQIAQSINSTIGSDIRPLEIIERNVAQFRSVDDLGVAITRVASVNNQRKLPLVFFDEFDCEFDGSPLGWLKYFLGPMQDGTFYGARQTISFGRAIFVFAGGLFRTIAKFNPYAEKTGSGGDIEARQEAFRAQKGPDFVSRLRGYINLKSINPDDTASKDDKDRPVKPIIRRALTLRGHILGAELVANRSGCKVATVDDDVLFALLTVKEYRHGARSMEAVLQMCTPIDGVIEKASLPSRAQLNMHVDAEDFVTQMLRGRFRHSIPRPNATGETAGAKSPTQATSPTAQFDADLEKVAGAGGGGSPGQSSGDREATKGGPQDAGGAEEQAKDAPAT